MKEKIYIIVAILIFAIVSFYLPVTNFKCGLQDNSQQSLVINGETVDLGVSHISCSNEVLKIFLNFSRLLTGLLFSIFFVVAFFKKNNLRKYFYIVATIFFVSLILKYALYGLIIYFDGQPANF